MYVDGNVYYNGAKSFGREKNSVNTAFDPKVRITDEGEKIYLYITLEKSLQSLKNSLITTQNLGKAMIPDQSYENPDGSPIRIDYDYQDVKRNEKRPSPGPFENPAVGRELKIKVWETVKK